MATPKEGAGGPRREDAVDERPPDEDVDLVEAVLDPRDADRDRERRRPDHDERLGCRGREAGVAGEEAGGDGGGEERGGTREPLELEPLLEPGAAVASDERGRREQCSEREQEP